MKLDEWRALRQDGEDATLPSGLDVRLRRVSVLDLAQSGQIPQTLRPKIEELIKNPNRQIGLNEMSELAEVVDLVAARCLAGPEGLNVGELPWADRLAIYQWANEASGRLETFRQQTGKPVGTTFDIGELRAKAERGPRA
jgi:hypothetical protein